MRVIWKYRLDRVDVMWLDLPKGAKVLSVGMQGELFDSIQKHITLWILVDPEAERHKRPFYIVGTGNPFPKEATTFIGTVFDSPFVWHVFE